MSTDNRARNIVIASLLGTLVFMAALGGFLWWYLGSEEDAVRDASDELITAIEQKDPGKAPDDAADYATGVPKYFGPVRDLKVVDARKVSRRNSTNSASQVSWWTTTLFLRSERGAAVLLVTFDQSLDPHDAKIIGIRELSPGKVTDGALSAAELKDVEAGFKSRGGKTANTVKLSGVLPEDSPSPADEPEPDKPAKPVPAPDRDEIERRRREGQRRLRCVQEARGDVDKLQKCAEL